MTLYVNGFFPGVLKPDTTVAGCIDIFENVWPDPKSTISAVEDQCRNPDSGAYWQRAETFGGGVYQTIRTNKMLNITGSADIYDNPVLQQIHNQFNMLLLASVQPYANRYGISDGLIHEPYSMLKYGENTEYQNHYDGGTASGRCVSAILYLNNNYSGGDIEFIYFNIKIKPEPGMLILFPSNFAYSHKAHPVTSGVKYALVTWIRDRDI
jgi:predicted 2-oxoglutarate/Fe(II)-dependent dioxygenase YbiX